MIDRRQGISLLLCCCLGLLTALSAHPVDGRQRAIAAPAPFTCDEPNDLIVEHGRITLHGTHFYDHVCMRDKGILTTSDALTLLAGTLYVARDSRISADGEDGALYYTHDCDTAGGHAQGLAGSPLTILADQAVIHGAISSNGGRGIDYSLPCGGGSGVLPIGRGGDAGTVTLIARAVVLDGSVSARGGDGGAATAKVPAAPGLPYYLQLKLGGRFVKG